MKLSVRVIEMPKREYEHFAQQAEQMTESEPVPVPFRFKFGVEFWLGLAIVIIVGCFAILWWMPRLPF